MYSIRKEFHFSAAHMLADLPPEHPCSRLHGHDYIVVVELRSATLDDRGFVVDYGELRALKEMIDESFDHRYLYFEKGVLHGIIYGGAGGQLSPTPIPSPSTAENIARFFYQWCLERWPETWAVEVSETLKTWARYCPHDNSFRKRA